MIHCQFYGLFESLVPAAAAPLGSTHDSPQPLPNEDLEALVLGNNVEEAKGTRTYSRIRKKSRFPFVLPCSLESAVLAWQLKDEAMRPLSSFLVATGFHCRRTMRNLCHLAFAVGVGAVTFGCSMQFDQNPKPLPTKLVAAWEKAGAEVGWTQPDELGFYEFWPSQHAVAGEIPAFRFGEWKPGIFETLPQPDDQFGLFFEGGLSPDGALKGLGGLKSIPVLSFRNTHITGIGLKELTGLKKNKGVGSLCSIDKVGAAR
jgi:hypothetical protein